MATRSTRAAVLDETSGRERSFFLILLMIAVPASAAIRLVNIVSPLLERHGFRQTQTAFTVWCDLTSGFTLFHPMTPVFGPPWQVPFECPIFQICAAAFAKLTGFEVDLACRLTALAFFYLSALALYSLVRGQISDKRAAAFVILAYLFSPFTIVWSRASLIEYAALFFALAYVDLLLRWLQTPGKAILLLGAIVAGALGSLTKITTMATVVPAILLCSLPLLALTWRGRASNRMKLCIIGLWLMALAIPLFVGQAWVWHADAIKSQFPMGRVLVSTAPLLTQWNYGTLAQRAHLANWGVIFGRISLYIFTLGFIAAPVLAVARIPFIDRREAIFVLSMVGGVLLPICLFFNLYLIHDYYLSAVSAAACTLLGLGLHQLWLMLSKWAQWRATQRAWILALMIVFLGGQYPGAVRAADYLRPSFTIRYDHPICQMGDILDRTTPADEVVILTGFGDWDPSILYYAKRRGLLVWKREPALETIRLSRFPSATVLCAVPDPELLDMWAHRQLIEQGSSMQVWHVWDYRGG